MKTIAVIIGLIMFSTAYGSDTNDKVTTRMAQWHKDGFDNILIADLRITNNTRSRVKDITVLCGGFTETGTMIDRNVRVVYKFVNPGQTIIAKEINMGFILHDVDSVGCMTQRYIAE